MALIGERKFKKSFRKPKRIERSIQRKRCFFNRKRFLGPSPLPFGFVGPGPIRNLLGFFVLPACPSKFNYLFNIEFTEYNKGFLPFPNQAP